MAIDHIGIKVQSDKVQAVVEFYLAALKPIGYKKLLQFGPEVFGLGETDADWWIAGVEHTPNTPLHVAFRVNDRKLVDEFHAAGLAAGGEDNGPPGVRPHSHPNYYGAFVKDPAGNNVEVVCHIPPAA